MGNNEYGYVKIVAERTVVAFGPKVGNAELVPTPGMPAGVFETITHAR